MAPNMFPSLSYDDAPTAIEWLCNAFGFTQRVVVPGPDGTVRHSELSLGDGVVMVGSARPGEGRLSPNAAGGVTSALSVRVEDPDAHCRRALDAGAELVTELKDEDFGSRGYMARDPEGHLWYFSTYQPGAYWSED